jgi:O-antigen ligase
MRKLAFWLSLIFVFTIPWEVVVEYPPAGSSSRLAGLALAAFWLLSVVVTGRVRSPGFFHFALGAFVALNTISILWSGNPERTTEHILTWVELLMMSLIIWDLYTTRKAVFAALQMYVLGGYVVIGDTLINFIRGSTFYYERYSAAGTNPDDLGAVLALGIPIAAYLVVFRPPDRLSAPLKVVNYGFIVAAFFGIALSGTRTALIAAVPGVLFCTAVMAHLRLSARIRVGVLFMIAAIVVVPRIPEASFQRLGTTQAAMVGGDLNGRVRLWREGLMSFERHPLLGVGSNMYRSVDSENKVAHNSFLSVLVELGIFGFLLFVLIIITAGYHIVGQAKWDRRFWLCIFAGWVIAASALTWEYRKPTWLFLNLIVVSAAVLGAHDTAPALPARHHPGALVKQPIVS